MALRLKPKEISISKPLVQNRIEAMIDNIIITPRAVSPSGTDLMLYTSQWRTKALIAPKDRADVARTHCFGDGIRFNRELMRR